MGLIASHISNFVSAEYAKSVWRHGFVISAVCLMDKSGRLFYIQNSFMNIRYLAIVSVFLSVTYAHAQTKPNKEETIAYLNEKLSLYNIEYFYSQEATCFGDKLSVIDIEKKYYYTYKVFSEVNRCYISFYCTYIHKTTSSGIKLTDQITTSFWKAPIDQIKSITIENDTSYSINESVNNNNCTKKIVYGTKYISIKLKSESLICHYTENGAKDDYGNSFLITIREGEANIYTKIKKALLNLKSLSPELNKKDPFDN